jgi:hypothetical protein
MQTGTQRLENYNQIMAAAKIEMDNADNWIANTSDEQEKEAYADYKESFHKQYIEAMTKAQILRELIARGISY